MRTKLILGGITALLTAGFLFILPGVVEHAYRQGTGFAYDRELTSSGLTSEQSRASGTHHLRVEAAKRTGVVYAALFIAGFHIPLFGIVILLLFYAFSKASAKLLLCGTAALICSGTAFSTLAQIQFGNDALAAITGSAGVWVLISVFLGILFALIWATKRFLKRKAA